MPIIWTQADPLKLRNSSSKSRCKGSCCFLYSYLELKKSEDLDRGYFCMYSWRHGDSLKGSPSQTTISHYVPFFGVLSDACSYIPICLRMVLVELMGFTKHGTLSDKTGIVSEFRLAMGLLCWLQFSWMMYTPHPVSMAVMYLLLWHLSVDGKILSGSESPKNHLDLHWIV